MCHDKGGEFIKRFIALFVLSVLVFVNNPNDILAHTSTIQEKINQAEPGDTIVLDTETIEEQIVINQSIHLIGQSQTKIVQRRSSPAIIINADDVTIENLTIIHKDSESDAPAVLVTGNNNELKHIQIETNSYGIYLDEANGNKLSHIVIIGDQDQAINERKHGIFIGKSHRNTIDHVNIRYVQDGVYLDKSNYTKLSNNSVINSRYGYHLMFTKNSVLEYNEALENISGLYVMGDKNTLIQHNVLSNNRENVQSIGLFVFDTTDAVIKENIIAHNRIGIYIESAEKNNLFKNKVQNNYIGLQIKDATKNQLTTNSFDANIVQGQAINSSDNLINGNYWADHLGLDVTGDLISDITYTVDPFFFNITKQNPAFQLLFQSPGLQFLQQLMHTSNEQLLVDHSPLVEDPLLFSQDNESREWILIGVSLFMFFLSIYIIYLGVNVNEKI